MYPPQTIARYFLCGAFLFVVAPVYAQTVPDAALLRQEVEQSLPSKLPSLPDKPDFRPSVMKPLGGTLVIKEFRFSGNTLLSSEVLKAVVVGWLNRSIDFNQLQEAVVAVAQYYRDAGWIVRAYLPQQEIVDGIVTIQIVEAVFGGIYFEGGDASRIGLDRLRKGLEATQTEGAPIKAKALDRALLLLGELPGVSVAGSLREGKRRGESDVVLKVADRPLFGGDASEDNTGSRSTGTNRFSLNWSTNAPLGFADQANVNLMHTQGSDYVRLGYSVPLGYDGWRMGLNTSLMRYRLISSELAALGGFGDSSTWGMDAAYPIYRSRFANLFFNSTFDYKDFNNVSSGATTTRYKMNVASIGLSGNLTDQLGGGGSNSASLTLTEGGVNLDGSPNQASDATTTQTQGVFAKLRYAASRWQTVTDSLGVNIGVTGQIANKNLDSGEKFYLGGSGGVRAYPGSEGGGSEGMMANVELRWRLQQGFNFIGFYDWGEITANRNNDFTGSAALNRYSLQGGGFSLGWQGRDGLSSKVVWAHRVGHNPNPTATGNDQDGSLILDRFWLSMSIAF